MKYKCQSCNQSFDSSMIVVETGYNFHPEVDDGNYEEIKAYLCPYCRSVAIDEMAEEEENE